MVSMNSLKLRSPNSNDFIFFYELPSCFISSTFIIRSSANSQNVSNHEIVIGLNMGTELFQKRFFGHCHWADKRDECVPITNGIYEQCPIPAKTDDMFFSQLPQFGYLNGSG